MMRNRAFVRPALTALVGVTLLATVGPLAAQDEADSLDPEQKVEGIASPAVLADDPLTRLMKPYLDMQAALSEQYRFDLGVGYTLLGQYATDVEDPSQGLITGSYDVEGNWRLIESDTWGQGALGFLVEGGQIIDHRRDEDLSANVGTIFGINDDADNEQIAVTELWWAHRLFAGQLTITAGKLDQTVFFDQNRVANDETAQFLATPLVNNPAIAFPDNGAGLNLWYEPAEAFYVTAGLGSSVARANGPAFQDFSGDRLFVAVEAGWTPTFDDELDGAYRLTLWRSEVDEADGEGIALSFDQEIVDRVIGFVRAGWADDAITDFESFVSGGVGVEEPIAGRADDFAAIGAAMGSPSDPSLDEPTLVEAFYRVQLTRGMAVSPHVQVVFNPGEATSDTATVLGLRLQTSY